MSNEFTKTVRREEIRSSTNQPYQLEKEHKFQRKSLSLSEQNISSETRERKQTNKQKKKGMIERKRAGVRKKKPECIRLQHTGKTNPLESSEVLK